MFEAVNLDGMDRMDLHKFAEKHVNHNDVGVRMLAQYAYAKYRAMERREVGDIPEAMKMEAKCEDIYIKLPVVLKW